MHRKPLDPADEVRAFLLRMADEVPADVPAPEKAIRRARRRLTLTVTVGVLVLALIGYGATAGIDAIREWSRPIPADTGPDGGPRFARQDLPGFVLRTLPSVQAVLPGSEVAGRFVRFGAGWWTPGDIEVVIFVPAGPLGDAGLEDAYGATFGTPDFQRADLAFERADAFPGSGTSLVSLAMLYPDAESAARGLRIFHPESPHGVFTTWRTLTAGGLGQEGFGVLGPARGMRSLAYVWRVDNLVLFVASQGHLPPDELLALADAMNFRVSS